MTEEVVKQIYTDVSLPILLGDSYRTPADIRPANLLSIHNNGECCLVEIMGIQAYIPTRYLYWAPERFGKTPSLTAKEMEELLAAAIVETPAEEEETQ